MRGKAVVYELALHYLGQQVIFVDGAELQTNWTPGVILMNFACNKIVVAQKLSEWQNFKDCALGVGALPVSITLVALSSRN